MDWNAFWNNGLVGVIVGSCLSVLSGAVISKLTNKDELTKAIYEKRLEKYEEISAFISELRISLVLTGEEANRNRCPLRKDAAIFLLQFPQQFKTKESLLQFQKRFTESLSTWTLYIDQDLFNSLTLLNAYFSHVISLCAPMSDENIHYVGYILGREIEQLSEDASAIVQRSFLNIKRKRKPASVKEARIYEKNNYHGLLLTRLLNNPIGHPLESCCTVCENDGCPFFCPTPKKRIAIRTV